MKRIVVIFIIIIISSTLLSGCAAPPKPEQMPFFYSGENENWSASWSGSYPSDFALLEWGRDDKLQSSDATLHFKGTTGDLKKIDMLEIRWSSASNRNCISDIGLFERNVSEPIKSDYRFNTWCVSDFTDKNDEVYWDVKVNGVVQRIVLKRADLGSATQNNQSDVAKRVAGYMIFIDQLIKQAQNDISLNDIKYLAIDSSQMPEMDNETHELLLAELARCYDYELLEKTYAQLVDEKYIVDDVFKNGALIQIKNVSIKKNQMAADASIFFAALGGHGFNGMQIVYSDGAWKTGKIAEIWIA